MERPAQRYFCNKCGYVGNVDLHSGCGYLAYHLAQFEQNYIDQLERELALLKASPASVPEGTNMDKQYLSTEFDSFFEFSSDDKSQVSSISAKLFAEHIAYPIKAEVERLRDEIAALRQNNRELLDQRFDLMNKPTPPASEDKDKIIASLQARIDELMLEYCPEEITTEQFAEYAKHQVPTMQEDKP